MKQKLTSAGHLRLKGCRPSEVIMQEYSNTCAQLGDVVGQIHRSHQIKQNLLNAHRDLLLELSASQEQEKKIAAEKAAEAAKTPTAEVAHA